MTEKKEISFRVFLAQKAADASREAAESFSEAGGLYEAGDIGDARSKVIEGTRRPQLVNNIASLINIIDTKIEEIKCELDRRPEHSYSTLESKLNLPEGYRLDLNLVLPEEEEGQVTEQIEQQPATLTEEPETGPDQEARTNEEIFASIENLANKLPNDLLYSSLGLSPLLPKQSLGTIDEGNTRKSLRFYTVQDYLSLIRSNYSFKREINLERIEERLVSKLEDFAKVEAGEIQPEAFNDWLAPEKIALEEGIGSGLEITREQYNAKIEALDLPTLAFNALRRSYYLNVGSVLSTSEEWLLALRLFGDRSYSHLLEKLKEKGFLPKEKPEPQKAEPQVETAPEEVQEATELIKAYEPWQGEEVSFPEGTIGEEFAQILKGRKRPRSLVEQKASEVPQFKSERIRNAISRLGVFQELTFVDILSKKPADLKESGLRKSQIEAVQEAVLTFARTLMYSPEVELLWQIYGKNTEHLKPLSDEEEEQLKSAVCEVISSLTPREQKVLIPRYGLEDFKGQDYKNVADQFNVTRERIRQIEAKSLRKLRHPSRSKRLGPYWSLLS